MPDEPEVLGLLALMEMQASRLAARTGPDGAFVPLTEQNRARWDQLLIHRGLAALARAETLGGADGPYALQAALAACHARARTAEDTDWPRIAALYDRAARSACRRRWSTSTGRSRTAWRSARSRPGARRAVAPAALRDYAPLPAARGDFLFRAGRRGGPRRVRAAARLTRNTRERAFLPCARRRSAAP